MDKIQQNRNLCGSHFNFPHFGSKWNTSTSQEQDAPFELIQGPCTPLYHQLEKKSKTKPFSVPSPCNQCVYDVVEQAQGGANQCGEICVGDGRTTETNAACHDPWFMQGPDYVPTKKEWCDLARCVEDQRKRNNPRDACKNPCEELDQILFNSGQLSSSHYCFGL